MAPRRSSAGSSASGSYSLRSYDGRLQEKKAESLEDPSYLSDDNDYSPYDSMLRAPATMSRIEPRASRARSSYAYRVPHRIMRYLCFALAGSILVFMLSLVRAGMNSEKVVLEMAASAEPPPPAWEAFPSLKRYYGGLRTLVSRATSEPEFPHALDKPRKETLVNSDNMHPVPASEEYNPYPDYMSQSYVSKFGRVNECFLDEQETIPSPKIHIFQGIPLGMPENAYGSYETLGLNDSICLDRFGRYGAYGYGYEKSKGGIGAGSDGEREGAERVWKKQKQIDYTGIDWGKAQRRCSQKNAHRFKPLEAVEKPMYSWNAVDHRAAGGVSDVPSWKQPFGGANDSGAAATLESPAAGQPDAQAGPHKIPRQAVIVRTWSDFQYREEHILYLRSMINELSIASGGEFDVFLLVHVKNVDAPIWADEEAYQQMLTDSLPPEFRSMGILWSESQMETIYRGVRDELDKPNMPPVLGVYRSLHLSLAYFSKRHPEYEFIWNFEMDIRYIGNWYDLFTNVGDWAAKQPRKGLWERNHRFYVPDVHGPWEDFSQMVRMQNNLPTPGKSKWANAGSEEAPQEEDYIDKPVWGPMWAEGDLAAKPFDDDPVPPTTMEKDKNEWGVGEDADLILFQPIFDPARTGWTLQRDFSGYNLGDSGTKGALPPRRVAIVAAGRLSRRLLDRMHRETALRKHSMFTEMFPPSMALHHGLKAVFAPHPVFIDRDWSLKYLTATFNSGPKGVTGRHKACIFGDCCQHNLLGVTWHYHAEFAGDLYKRWWGLVVNGSGGESEEMQGEGRMCLPPMLLHPIKEVDLPITALVDSSPA